MRRKIDVIFFSGFSFVIFVLTFLFSFSHYATGKRSRGRSP